MKTNEDQPFRSRAERESDREMIARYKALGNPELLAEHAVDKQLQQTDSTDKRQQG